MKKTFYLLFSVILLLMPLYSVDIVGSGSGSSKEEAILRARQDLQTSIRVNVSVSTTVSVFENGKNSDNIFFGSSTSTSSGILKGISENATLKENGTWEATCVISESKSYLYEDALKDTINSINNCQKQIDKGISAKEEISYLQIQIEQYELFDFYSDILLMLGHGTAEKPVVGKENVQSRYNIVFSQIDSPALVDIDQEKNREEYEKALALYEERKKINDEIKKEKEIELQQYQEKLSIEQKKTLSSYEEKANKAYQSLIDKETSTYSYKALVSSFLENRTALKNFYNENTKSFISLNKTSENLITKTRNSIFARPYDSIAEMKNGKPTLKALAERTRLADNETKKIIDEQNKLYVEAFSAFQTSATKLYSVYNPSMKKINGNFTVSSTSQDTSFIVGRYDASSYSWPFAFSFTILGQPVTVNGYISDTEVSRLGKESEKDWRKDAEYHSLVELYDAFFHSDNTLMITCNFRSSAVNSTGKIDISCYSYKITRLDNSSTVGSENLNINFSYEYEKENSLVLVLYALGDSQDAVTNAKDLFLGESLSALSVYTTSCENKENYSIATISIQESAVPQIQTLWNNLSSEFRKKIYAASINSKGYNSILEKYVERGKVTGILVAFGQDSFVPFKIDESQYNTYLLDSIKELYVEKIKAGVSRADLNNEALAFVNRFSSFVMTENNKERTEINDFFDNYEMLVEKRKELQSKIKSSQITYTDEELSTDYSDLQELERKLTSETCEITLNSGDFVSSVVIDNIDIENLKLRYAIDTEELSDLKSLSFEIPLSQIIGTAPTGVEEKEAYYQKALGVIYLYTKDQSPFYVSLMLSVNTNSTGKEGLVSEYIPFTQSQVICTYSVNSSIDNSVLITNTLSLNENNLDPLSLLSSEVDTRFIFEERLELERKELKKQKTKNAISDFFKESRYGLALFYQFNFQKDKNGILSLRASAIKYDDHLYYGLGVGFLHFPVNLNNKIQTVGGIGVDIKFGVKTSVKNNELLEVLQLFLTAGGYCSLDFIPSLYGAIPNFIGGISAGVHCNYFEVFELTVEFCYGFYLGKKSGIGPAVSFILTPSVMVMQMFKDT